MKISKPTALFAAVLMAASATEVSAITLYEAPTDVVGGYCPACAGTSTTLGDDISIVGGPARLTSLTWDTSNFGADYDAEIKVDFFNVDLSGSDPALGSAIFSQTSTHFLSGGNGSSSRTFVDMLLDVVVPERFIYTISVVNNNGLTNWNMAGQFADNSADEDPSLADPEIGINHETDYFFSDWVSESGANPATLFVERQGMGSYQLGLPVNDSFVAYSNVTPNVDFFGQSVAPIPLPAALPLLLVGLGALGLVGRRKFG